MNTEELVRWIVQNVDPVDVPMDEGSDDGLVWNLVQLARYGRPYTAFDYTREQYAEVAGWRKQYAGGGAGARGPGWLLCAVGLHRWSRWSKIREWQYGMSWQQQRHCERCCLIQRRDGHASYEALRSKITDEMAKP